MITQITQINDAVYVQPAESWGTASTISALHSLHPSRFHRQ